MALDITLKPLETLLFRSDIVAFGTFRCPATHPLFRDTGPSSHHTFVFPRTSTLIRHAGGKAFTATPNCVTLYNQQQEYTRTAVSSIDASDWFVMADDVYESAKPFGIAHVPIDEATYLAQRRLFDALDTLDVFEIEERALTIWSRVARAIASSRAQPPRHRERIEEAKRLVAAAPGRSLSLRQLAAATQWSPFHLCREFREATGLSLTDFRHSMRLRLALDLVRDTRDDLTGVALNLGYSSHSHFTSAFRRRFGMTPSQYRARSR